MDDDLVRRLSSIADILADLFPEFSKDINSAADRIEKLRAALEKIAAIEDEHINVPKTDEGANLLACLAMRVELAETALGEKKDG
jgi:hypothetical protein